MVAWQRAPLFACLHSSTAASCDLAVVIRACLFLTPRDTFAASFLRPPPPTTAADIPAKQESRSEAILPLRLSIPGLPTSHPEGMPPFHCEAQAARDPAVFLYSLDSLALLA